MTATAILSGINPPLSTTSNCVISPPTFSAFVSDCSLTVRNSNNNRSNLVLRIKSTVSDSMAIIDTPTPAAVSEEEVDLVKVGARVRVKVPLKVYHIPKVPEVELNEKEGKLKEYVAVWKGKNISANFPYKIEFFEKLEGRGDSPVKFFVHLKEDEFDYID